MGRPADGRGGPGEANWGSRRAGLGFRMMSSGGSLGKRRGEEREEEKKNQMHRR